MRNILVLLGFLSGAMALRAADTDCGKSVSAAEARAIAKEAYTYGFPLVDSYRVQYSYFVNTQDPEYKGAWNEVHNTARVFTPDDKVIQTPNSDTPYSAMGADLRAEPLVISVPKVEKERYYSLQFIDLYTFNFAYVGSRATGNEAGSYLLVGPYWQGAKPAGIKDIIRSETDLVMILYRTQLLGPGDLENVKKIQAGYKVQALSQFLGRAAPAAAPSISFMNPLTRGEEKTSLDFFKLLNFVLQFGPVHPTEKTLMDRFAKICVGAKKNFDGNAFDPAIRSAIQSGITDSWLDLDKLVQRIDRGELSSSQLPGSRASLQNNYLFRMALAVLGIYGNTKEEAIYPGYFTDSSGSKLNGSHRYTLRFERGQLPPVNAFWSVTMYQLPESLLVKNPIDRYLINSSMLPSLKRDADGSITLYIQNDNPGGDKESNWLPAPKNDFLIVMRLYWPKPEALNGPWMPPKMERTN